MSSSKGAREAQGESATKPSVSSTTRERSLASWARMSQKTQRSFSSKCLRAPDSSCCSSPGTSGSATIWEWGWLSVAPEAAPLFLKKSTLRRRTSRDRSSMRSCAARSTCSTCSGLCCGSWRACSGVSMITSCAPTPPITSYIPRPARTMRSSVRRAGNRLGTTRSDQPGPLGGPPLSRWTSSSGGVIASCPGQKGQPAGSSRSGGMRTSAFGRYACELVMITQRPTTGSLRSSGMAAHHNIPGTRSLNRPLCPRWDALRSGAFGASTRGELAPPLDPPTDHCRMDRALRSDAPVGELELAIGDGQRDLAVARQTVHLHLVAQDPQRQRDPLARLQAQRLAGERQLHQDTGPPRPTPRAPFVGRRRLRSAGDQPHPHRLLAGAAGPGEEHAQLAGEIRALRRIQAQVEVRPGEPEPHLGERTLAAEHRSAAGGARPVVTGAGPLEVPLGVPVDGRLDEPRGLDDHRGSLGGVLVRRDDGATEPFGRRQAEGAPGLRDAAAEERVELGRVFGGEVVAVPPEPVAAFGDKEVPPRLLELLPRQLALLLRLGERRARLEEPLPRAGVVLPGVLPVERERDQRLRLGVCDAGDQVLRRLARVALRIPEADPVGQLAVAEQHGHGVVGPREIRVVMGRVAVGQRGPQLQ